MMDNLFDALINAQRVAGLSQELLGRVQAVKWAITYRNDDPMKLHRIQVLEPEKGAKSSSPWLFRCSPYGGLSLPIPNPGDTVLVGYIDGNPHDGVYIATVHNLSNPPLGDGSNFVLALGTVTITINPSGQVSLEGLTTLTINGKEVTTVEARDSRGDILVTKGWS